MYISKYLGAVNINPGSYKCSLNNKNILSTEKELLTMVRAVSEDQIYDTIEFNEFLQMMSKQQKDGLNEGALKDAFR